MTLPDFTPKLLQLQAENTQLSHEKALLRQALGRIHSMVKLGDVQCVNEWSEGTSPEWLLEMIENTLRKTE